MTKEENKRRFPRIHIQSQLRYQVRGSPEISNTVADNISVGGLSFIGNSFIAPLTNLNLEVDVLSRILNITGKVAWASPLPHSDRYRLGVEFVEFDEMQERYLSDYIDLHMATI